MSGAGTTIRYVLDLAEIPSFELLQQWGLNGDSPRDQLDRKAEAQASAPVAASAAADPQSPFLSTAADDDDRPVRLN